VGNVYMIMQQICLGNYTPDFIRIKFYRRYYRKYFVLFFPDTVYLL